MEQECLELVFISTHASRDFDEILSGRNQFDNVTEELQSQHTDMAFLTAFASVGRLEGSNYKSLQ